MDPIALWDRINNGVLPIDERRAAALDMLVWIAKGGTVDFVNHLTPCAYVVDACEGWLARALDDADGYMELTSTIRLSGVHLRDLGVVVLPDHTHGLPMPAQETPKRSRAEVIEDLERELLD